MTADRQQVTPSHQIIFPPALHPANFPVLAAVGQNVAGPVLGDLHSAHAGLDLSAIF
jgi:hypothetical protein